MGLLASAETSCGGPQAESCRPETHSRRRRGKTTAICDAGLLYDFHANLRLQRPRNSDYDEHVELQAAKHADEPANKRSLSAHDRANSSAPKNLWCNLCPARKAIGERGKMLRSAHSMVTNSRVSRLCG